ncbi:hypothetical protein E4U21_000193 [Claviceps maximensis]|nr:hypothetical protein E4U21_000193 [Claviceps maximensis]
MVRRTSIEQIRLTNLTLRRTRIISVQLSMTSTKPFRTTMLPPSFSFPSLRSRSDSDARPSTDVVDEAKSFFEVPKRRRKAPWQKASLHLPRGRKVVMDRDDQQQEQQEQHGQQGKHGQHGQQQGPGQYACGQPDEPRRPATATATATTAPRVMPSSASAGLNRLEDTRMWAGEEQHENLLFTPAPLFHTRRLDHEFHSPPAPQLHHQTQYTSCERQTTTSISSTDSSSSSYSSNTTDSTDSINNASSSVVPALKLDTTTSASFPLPRRPRRPLGPRPRPRCSSVSSRPPLPLHQRKPAAIVTMSPPPTPLSPSTKASMLDVDDLASGSPQLHEQPLQQHPHIQLPQHQDELENSFHQELEQYQILSRKPVPPPTSLAARSGPPELPELSFSSSAQLTHETSVPPKQRAKLTKQEPVAALAGPPNTSPVDAHSDVESQRRGKLHKEPQKSRPRTNSLFQPKLTDSPPKVLAARQLSPAAAAAAPAPPPSPPAPSPPPPPPAAAATISEPRGRRTTSAQASLAPSVSLPNISSNVRPSSSHNDSPSPSRGRLHRSWLPGGGSTRSRSNSVDPSQKHTTEAWVMSDETQPEYNPAFLRNAEKVPELWNDNGNVYVYLYPRTTGCGPSFKVPEFVVGTSYVFNELIYIEGHSPATDRMTTFDGRDNLSAQDAARTAITSPSSPTAPVVVDDPYALRLYLPAAPPTASSHLGAPNEGTQEELDRLIAIRNLFAFLTGQPLVGTKTRPTMFHAFVEIAALLQEFGFSSPDGTNFGEAVDLSFGFYSEQLALSDCRLSREKTVEALILGERMRCVDLYNEAFAHAAGKYSAIIDLRLPLFDQVSALTRQRLERAHLDLLSRQHNVNEHLEQFEFPSMFAGIATSTSIPELKQVRFKTWRSSFGRMRQFLSGYYRSTFGSWPPKASNKKNPFAESGLNRLVLKVLYSDMCALYDLLVDRDSLTSRVMDEVPAISDAPSKMTTSALRNMLSEFDRSKPPVLPPIPFDLPQLPSMKTIHETFDTMSAKDQNKMEKRIKEHELMLILNKAYNYDTNRIKLPFLDQFKEFEIREGRGKVTQDLVDQRIGYWLFLYAVLQSLPMLVVDAPGVKYSEGVEYFLCEPPMGNLPWVEDGQVRKIWYEVTGGGGIVELSADAVMFSVEAIYRRSHCWLAAKHWEGLDEAYGGGDDYGNDYGDDPTHEPCSPFSTEESPLSPLQPPLPMFTGAEPSSSLGRPSSPRRGPSTPSPPPGGPKQALRPRNQNLAPAQRSRHFSRSSIAMGLEPVPMNPPNVFGGHNRSSSNIGFRPPSRNMMAMEYRSSSVGNLVALTPSSGSSSPAPLAKPAATSGATFDDILRESLSQKKAAAAKKKKNRFF